VPNEEIEARQPFAVELEPGIILAIEEPISAELLAYVRRLWDEVTE
jgi:hypothetical protein